MKRIKISLLVLFLLLFTSEVYSAWDGPVDVVVGAWGTGLGQFGFESGDTADSFPKSIGISSSGKIVIADNINEVLHTFNSNGSFLRDIKRPTPWEGWPYSVDSVNGECAVVGYVEYTHTFNVTTGELVGVANNMGGADYISEDCTKIYVYTEGKTWKVYSPTGNLIRTTTDRPLELGRVKEKKTAGGYTYTIQYPDITNPNTVKTYTVSVAENIREFKRDANGNLYGIATAAGEDDNDIVYRYDINGVFTGKMQIPPSEYGEIIRDPFGATSRSPLIVQYGSAVISPTGDVYTWKRTPTTYSIIKWTWRP